MRWGETSRYLCTVSLYLCTASLYLWSASLYLCTTSLYLEKVVASKQLKIAMETDIGRKARLEKMVATTQLRLSLKIFFFSRNELARPVMGTIFLVYICMSSIVDEKTIQKNHNYAKMRGGIT